MNDVVAHGDSRRAIDGLCVVQCGQQVDCCVYKLKTINTLTACF